MASDTDDEGAIMVSSLPLRCGRCKISFQDSAKFDEHMQKTHSSAGPTKTIRCPVAGCGLSFATNKALKLHDTRVHKIKNITCATCGKDFASQASLTRHMATHKAKPHLCSIAGCLKVFKTSEELEKHKNTHKALSKATIFKCDPCNEYFTTVDTFEKHNNSHTGRQTKCTQCGELFDVSSEFVEHMRTMHHRSIDPLNNDIQAESETAEEPDENLECKFLEKALGIEVQDSVLATISAAQDVISLQVLSSQPATLRPTQIYLNGKNLKKFKHGLYTDPLASVNTVNQSQGDILKKFLDRTPFRKVNIQYHVDGSTSYIDTIRASDTHDECSFDVSEMFLEHSQATQLTHALQLILERLPVMLREITKTVRLWVFAAATRVSLRADSGFKVKLRVPAYEDRHESGFQSTIATKEQHSYAFTIIGYDPQLRTAWSKKVWVRVGTIDENVTIEIPCERQIEWVGDFTEPTEDTSQYMDKKHFRLAYQASQYIVAKYFGAIGDKEGVYQLVGSDLSRFWPAGKETTRRHLNTHQSKSALSDSVVKPWNGEKFCAFEPTASRLQPTAWMKRSMKIKNPIIVLPKGGTEYAYLTINAMLRTLQAGHNTVTAWAVGCHEADILAKTTSDGPPIIEACQDIDVAHQDFLHICPECLQFVRHTDLMLLSELRQYAICPNCRDKIRLNLENFKKEGGVLGYNLYALLEDENVKSQTNKTTAQLQQDFREVLASIADLKIDDNRWHDIYAEQITNTFRTAPTAWDGVRVHPGLSSVEAIDPTVVGSDGMTHYHVKGNIAVTSDAMNKLKSVFPPIVLHGFLLFAKAQDRKTYESAIALFRACLLNHYEYGYLQHREQAYRIGKVPPANMHSILASYRQPVLLPRTSRDVDVWRYFNSGQKGTIEDRLAWRHEYHDWIVCQLNEAARSVFGSDAKSQQYRHYWMRRNSSGTEVFFPFSQYSVIPDFTWFDLFEILGVRTDRNIATCQAPHARMAAVQGYTLEELLLVVAYVWMYMIKSDIESNKGAFDYGRDQLGLVPQPTINTPLCASLGHRWHGVEQDLGLDGFELGNFDAKITFDRDRCGFLWETKACNFMKFKYPDDILDSQVFSQINKIRLENTLKGYEILPETLIQLELKDELKDPFPPGTKVTESARYQKIEAPVSVANSLAVEAVQSDDLAHATPEAAALAGTEDQDGLPSLIQNNAKDQTVFINVSADAKPISIVSGHPPEIPNSDDEGEEILMSGIQKHNNYAVADTQPHVTKLLTIKPSASPTPVTEFPILTTKRNMKNIGQTCYLSSVVQIISNLYNFSLLGMSPNSFRLLSGRKPDELERYGDPDGSLHVSVLGEFCRLAGILSSGGRPLPPEATIRMLAACNALQNRWDNEKADSPEFFNWIMEKLEIATDNSSPITSPDIWVKEGDIPELRPAYRPEEVENFKNAHAASKGKIQISLQEACSAHWEAHKLSGHLSIVNDQAAIQLVDIYECNHTHCVTLRRDISYTHQFLLQIPQTTRENEIISFKRLVSKNLETMFDPSTTSLHDDIAPSCPNTTFHSGLVGAPKGKLIRKVTRVARAPPIFSVEIRRGKDPDFSITGENYSEVFFENRLSDYRSFSMQDWSNSGPSITDKPALLDTYPGHEILEGDRLESEYDLVAILAFSPAIKHYTCFVKINGVWVYFNDMEAYPVKRDPFVAWPAKFYECSLHFKVRDFSVQGPVQDSKEMELNEPLITTGSAQDIVQDSAEMELTEPSVTVEEVDPHVQRSKFLGWLEGFFITSPTEVSEQLFGNIKQLYNLHVPQEATQKTAKQNVSAPIADEHAIESDSDSEPIRGPSRYRLVRRASHGLEKMVDMLAGRKQDRPNPATPTKKDQEQKAQVVSSPSHADKEPRSGGLLSRAADRARHMGQGVRSKKTTPKRDQQMTDEDPQASPTPKKKNTDVVMTDQEPMMRTSQIPKGPPKSVKKRKGSVGATSTASKRSRYSIQDPAEVRSLSNVSLSSQHLDDENVAGEIVTSQPLQDVFTIPSGNQQADLAIRPPRPLSPTRSLTRSRRSHDLSRILRGKRNEKPAGKK